MDAYEPLDGDFEALPKPKQQDTFDAATASLKAEYEKRYAEFLGSTQDAAQKVRRLIASDLTQVTSNLVAIALHNDNSRLRLDACKYLLDRMVFNNKATDDEVAKFFETIAAGADSPTSSTGANNADSRPT